MINSEQKRKGKTGWRDENKNRIQSTGVLEGEENVSLVKKEPTEMPWEYFHTW